MTTKLLELIEELTSGGLVLNYLLAQGENRVMNYRSVQQSRLKCQL